MTEPTLTLDGLNAMMRSIPRAPPVCLQVVPSWLSGYQWVDGGPCRTALPHGQRKGTKRQANRRANRNTGWRRRWVPVEPNHMMRLADGTTFCTEKQYRVIQQMLKPKDPTP